MPTGLPPPSLTSSGRLDALTLPPASAPRFLLCKQWLQLVGPQGLCIRQSQDSQTGSPGGDLPFVGAYEGLLIALPIPHSDPSGRASERAVLRV